MPQATPQPHVQQDFQDLTRSGLDVGQPFDRALFGGGVIAPSDLRELAATPSSVPELFDLRRPFFKQSWRPDWDRGRKERSSDTKAGPTQLANRKDKAVEPPGCSVKIRTAEQKCGALNHRRKL